MSNWPRVRISEVCELIVDCVNKTAPSVPYVTNYKMIRTPNIRNGRVDRNECRYAEKETYEKWTRRANVLEGDVLLTREAPMGQVGYVDFNDTVFLGQRIMQYRANPKLLDSRYLLYAFLSADLQHQFLMHEGSGSVVSHIRVPDCLKFELNLPPLKEQKRVAKMLSDLDNKIEKNRQINQTLEAMAQAIFQSWFVDFDPVKAKIAAREQWQTLTDDERSEWLNDILSKQAYLKTCLSELSANNEQGASETLYLNIAAMTAISSRDETSLADMPADEFSQLYKTASLFPERLVESELGEIPEGWEVKKIENVISRISAGKRYSQKTVVSEGSVPVLDQGKSGVIGFHDDEPSVMASNEKPVIVFANHTCYMRIIMFPFSTIQNVLPFVDCDLNIYWLYFATLGKQNFVEYKGHWPDFVISEIVIPNKETAVAFGDAIKASIISNYVRENENEVLVKLRDNLLPKLLSGELDISVLSDIEPAAMDV